MHPFAQTCKELVLHQLAIVSHSSCPHAGLAGAGYEIRKDVYRFDDAISTTVLILVTPY
jgi:hypothetical protein